MSGKEGDFGGVEMCDEIRDKERYELIVVNHLLDKKFERDLMAMKYRDIRFEERRICLEITGHLRSQKMRYFGKYTTSFSTSNQDRRLI